MYKSLTINGGTKKPSTKWISLFLLFSIHELINKNKK